MAAPTIATAKRSVWEGFAGTTDGSFFRAPKWVDVSKPPGATSQSPSLADNPKWRELLTCAFLICGPNLVWLSIALAVYFAFPYNYSVTTSLNREFGVWVAKRLVLNHVIVFSYYGFWHATLYWMNWCERPFNPSRRYRIAKLLHNAWYSSLGVLQWTAWEAMFVYSYATGRLPYLSNAEAFSSPQGWLQFLIWFPVVPVFREVHFYFAHRLIHIKVLYNYVHSVHHRNTDVEPFSGICMHPVEHMYYFTSVAPALFFFASPFGFLWNGVHLLLSPAASHSGYEDHFQSDQYHYLHHRYFECNYGTPTFMLDRIFGTFRESISDKSEAYRGDACGVGENIAAAHDARATLSGWPDAGQLLFNVVFCILIPLFVACAWMKVGGADKVALPSIGVNNAHLVAAIMTLGPIFCPVILLLLKTTVRGNRRFRGDGSALKAMSYPFHKESLFGRLGFHMVAGFTLGVLPAYVTIHMALSQPGESAFFIVRNLLPWKALFPSN